MGHEDVDVDLVDQFDGILAVGVVSVVDCLEQGIAFPVEILFGHEGVSAQYGLGDLLIGIAIEVHVCDWFVAVGFCNLLRRDLDFIASSYKSAHYSCHRP